MNFNFTSILLVALLFLTPTAFCTINAATITWTADSGDWNVSSNWDTNTIPQSGDDVIISATGFSVTIPSGFSAFAATLLIADDTRFTIEDEATLLLDGASGGVAFTNNGTAFIYGDVEIANVSNDGIGIFNTYRFYVRPSGSLDLHDIDGTSISNDNRFYNLGTIGIQNVEGHGIENNDYFYNYDNLIITLNVGSINSNINNHGRFYNFSNGDIILQQGLEKIRNTTGSRFYNFGELVALYGTYGIFNQGAFYNLSDGLIIIKGMNSNGFSNHDYTVNYGDISVGANGWVAFSNIAMFRNYGSLYGGDSQYAAMYNHTDGNLTNYGEITLEDAGLPLINYAEFHNRTEAVLRLSGGGSSVGAGMLTNDGLISAEVNGPFLVINGDELTNNGAIESKNGTGIRSTAINNQVVFDIIGGFVEDGIPKTNVFDVNGWDNVDVLGVYTTSNGNVSAGTYNITSNTLTVNSNAVGLSNLFFEILIDGTYQYMIQAALSNPVQSANAPEAQSRLQQKVTDDFQIYPNPSNGFINVQSRLFESETAIITILNLQGAILFERNVEKVEKLNIQLPESINSGHYILQVHNAKGQLQSAIFSVSRF